MGNLEYRLINKAGHHIAMDQPEVALSMVRAFVDTHKDWQIQ